MYATQCAHCGVGMLVQWVSEMERNWCDNCRALGAELWRRIGKYRTELAEREFEERQARWLENCAPERRRGAHYQIRPDESQSFKHLVDRYHQVVDPTKSRRAAKPKLHLADPGLRTWSDQTCSREEYFKMMDRESERREEWLL